MPSLWVYLWPPVSVTWLLFPLDGGFHAFDDPMITAWYRSDVSERRDMSRTRAVWLTRLLSGAPMKQMAYQSCWGMVNQDGSTGHQIIQSTDDQSTARSTN